jgi:hypothetical protein
MHGSDARAVARHRNETKVANEPPVGSKCDRFDQAAKPRPEGTGTPERAGAHMRAHGRGQAQAGGPRGKLSRVQRLRTRMRSEPGRTARAVIRKDCLAGLA